MRHTTLVVHQLHLDGAPMTLRHGTLAVVDRGAEASLDWELVADGRPGEALGMRRYELTMNVITGAEPDGTLEFADLAGEAIMVRWVDTTAVLRGDGPLLGFDPSWLDRAE